MARVELFSCCLLVPLTIAACAAPATDGGETGTLEAVDRPPWDLIPAAGRDGKADSVTFDKHNLVEQAMFEDAGYLSVDEIQDFLDSTPYGHASYLATYAGGGQLASEMIWQASVANNINPLIILTKIQVESSMIASKVDNGNLFKVLGCGCPDNKPCAEEFDGFSSQVECSAEKLRSYLTDLDTVGETIAGWRVKVAKKTLDPEWVTPENAATAALYTYTPWVSTGSGGNWLFWNIWWKYREYVGDKQITPPNHHWIGGACAGSGDCPYPSGACLEAGEASFCTQQCTKFCPDQGGNNSATFCVDLGSQIAGNPGGYCVSQCDTGLYPGSGCAAGFECVTKPRFGDAGTSKAVCWPVIEDAPVTPPDPAPGGTCSGPPKCPSAGVCSQSLAPECEATVDRWICWHDLAPGYEYAETSCDGLDNDCDGHVDEGCNDEPAPEPQALSACYPGANNSWTTCFPVVSKAQVNLSGYDYPSGAPAGYLSPQRFLDLTAVSPEAMLAPNFKAKELMQLWKGRYAVYSPKAVSRWQSVRNALGAALTVTSGFRGPGYNKTVPGSATYSRHIYGDAADVTANGAKSLSQIKDACYGQGADFVKVYETHVHCDWRYDTPEPAFFDVGSSKPGALPDDPARAWVEQRGDAVVGEPVLLMARWEGFDEGNPWVTWHLSGPDGDETVERALGIWITPERGTTRVRWEVGGLISGALEVVAR